jgi:hypothetical protein
MAPERSSSTSSQITSPCTTQIKLPTRKTHRIADTHPAAPPTRATAQIYRRRPRPTNRRGRIKPGAILREENIGRIRIGRSRSLPAPIWTGPRRGEAEGRRRGRGREGEGGGGFPPFAARGWGRRVFFFRRSGRVPRFVVRCEDGFETRRRVRAGIYNFLLGSAFGTFSLLVYVLISWWNLILAGTGRAGRQRNLFAPVNNSCQVRKQGCL